MNFEFGKKILENNQGRQGKEAISVTGEIMKGSEVVKITKSSWLIKTRIGHFLAGSLNEFTETCVSVDI